MKKVLVIDDSDLFREFIAQKLAGFGFDVSQANNGFDGLMKLRSENPDLIIMDYYLSRNSSIEVLEKKAKDLNRKAIPVIMASAKIDRDSLIKVSQFGVKKFFTKPIKVDAFIKAVSEILGVNLDIDTTPCIIDANYNDEIIFIEVARGLNKDKIELLKFRLQELIELHHIVAPKVLLLLTGLSLKADDSLLLAGLLNNVLDYAGAHPHAIRILTTSPAIKPFLRGKDRYQGIEIADNIEDAIDSLLGKASIYQMNSGNSAVDPQFLPSASKDAKVSSTVNLGFATEENRKKAIDFSEIGRSLHIAIVDDDPVMRALMQKAFEASGAKLSVFDDGAPFIASNSMADYDLVFLDLMMPETDGFQVLQSSAYLSASPPVIVLSALSKRDSVARALQLGVKSYMIKPIMPDMVLRKAAEILQSNF